MARKAESKFGDLVRRDLKDLEKKGFLWAVRVEQESMRGTPDWLVCVGGLFYALELKRLEGIDGDSLQQYNINRINQCGGRAYIVNPSNWETIINDIIRITVKQQRARKE